MRRYADWPSRFRDGFLARIDQRFAWGEHDCCAAVAGLLEAMTGTNVLAELPAYDCEAEAFAILADAGGLRRLARDEARRHGLERIDVGFASRGDLVVIRAADSVEDQSLALLHLNPEGLVFVERDGWSALPVATAVRRGQVLDAYRVPG